MSACHILDNARLNVFFYYNTIILVFFCFLSFFFFCVCMIQIYEARVILFKIFCILFLLLLENTKFNILKTWLISSLNMFMYTVPQTPLSPTEPHCDPWTHADHHWPPQSTLDPPIESHWASLTHTDPHNDP